MILLVKNLIEGLLNLQSNPKMFIAGFIALVIFLLRLALGNWFNFELPEGWEEIISNILLPVAQWIALLIMGLYSRLINTDETKSVEKVIPKD